MLSKFTSFIQGRQLLAPGEKILLAISAGMDSMAMAELFHLAEYEFAIAHCNFKLRGQESDEDESFVKQAAERYEVSFYCKSFNTSEIADRTGASVQMTARELRYDYFRELAAEQGFDYIATAHHLDDQSETFFINLVRGCGIAGLHGIRMKQGKLIRPMMFAHREEIEGFVKRNNISYREDSSNQSVKYLRNKVRHELIPVLREMNPNFNAEMAANISRIADVEAVYRQYLEKCKNEVIETGKDGVTCIDIKRLIEYQPLHTFLYEFISEYGFKNDDVKDIVKAMTFSGKKFFSPTYQLIIDRKKIIISKKRSTDPLKEIFINENDRKLASPVRLGIEIYQKQGYIIPGERNIASLDYEKLQFPLRLRPWKEGDSFVPLGMKNNKKLSDFFIDEKYSILQKQQAWLLCSGDDIVWIVGDRIDDRYKITDKTETVYRISYQK